MSYSFPRSSLLKRIANTASSTIVVGIIRTIKVVTMDFKDPSYSGMVPDLLTILEVGVAIIVSSSTILRPVFDRVFHSIASFTGSQKYPDQSNTRSQSRSRSRKLSDSARLGPSSTDKPNKAQVWTDEVSLGDMEDRRKFPYGRMQDVDDHSSEERILGPDETGNRRAV